MLRAAWSGDDDPKLDDPNVTFHADGGYWHPQFKSEHQYGLPNRPLFTMGEGATMSAGIIIAHKSVPLPTVLESLWEAESDRAKKLKGYSQNKQVIYPYKDGCCFRVIYGGGNTLEALMKGHLLSDWWQWLQGGREETTAFAPVLYRLAEELPRHAAITENYQMVSKAARVILTARDEPLSEELQDSICNWLDEWEKWAFLVKKDWDIKHPDPEKLFECDDQKKPLGIEIEDLAKILRFSAFWIDKMAKHDQWLKEGK
ncbi:MAG: hypothetical protein F6K03_08810 [Kamptonema sp. SIO4C4]|nr:hypothetical protein [Kamptonema sp. SIO4C4]